MKRLILLALMVSLLAACGPATVQTPFPTLLPTLTSEWTVKLAQSGGIMGMLQVIEVSSDGKFRATDERAQKTVQGQLSASDLSHLKGLVADALKINSAMPQNGCMDCFIFTVEITESGKPVQSEVNELGLPNSGLEPLVSFLQEAMKKALK